MRFGFADFLFLILFYVVFVIVYLDGSIAVFVVSPPASLFLSAQVVLRRGDQSKRVKKHVIITCSPSSSFPPAWTF